MLSNPGEPGPQSHNVLASFRKTFAFYKISKIGDIFHCLVKSYFSLRQSEWQHPGFICKIPERRGKLCDPIDGKELQIL